MEQGQVHHHLRCPLSPSNPIGVNLLARRRYLALGILRLDCHKTKQGVIKRSRQWRGWAIATLHYQIVTDRMFIVVLRRGTLRIRMQVHQTLEVGMLLCLRDPVNRVVDSRTVHREVDSRGLI